MPESTDPRPRRSSDTSLSRDHHCWTRPRRSRRVRCSRRPASRSPSHPGRRRRTRCTSHRSQQRLRSAPVGCPPRARIASRDGRSKVENDRNRAVVHQLNLHPRTEDPCFDLDAFAAQGVDERLDQRVRDLGRRRARKAPLSSLVTLAIQARSEPPSPPRRECQLQASAPSSRKRALDARLSASLFETSCRNSLRSPSFAASTKLRSTSRCWPAIRTKRSA